MNKNSCAVITGVAGFIGSNLADSLIKEGYKVIGIDNLSHGIKSQVPSEVEFYDLDIRSKDIYPLFREGDFVFHLAAISSISDCQKDPIEASDINITGAINVFEAAYQAGVKKVIYAETSALYEGIDVFPTSEMRIAPKSFYAFSKACENLFAEGYKNFRGLTMIGLRYFNVYGYRQDYRRTIPPVISSFIIKLLKKESPIIYGDGSKKRDFIYVDDVNDFHLLCLKDDRVNNKIFNLGSGESHSVLEVYEKIKEILKVDIKPIFQKDLEGDEIRKTLADITEAKKIGWTPKKNFTEGLEDMVRYIKAEIKKGNIV